MQQMISYTVNFLHGHPNKNSPISVLRYLEDLEDEVSTVIWNIVYSNFYMVYFYMETENQTYEHCITYYELIIANNKHHSQILSSQCKL